LGLERAEGTTAAAGGELQTARREVDRMAALVDSLVVLARDSAREPAGEAGNLCDLVRETGGSVFPGGRGGGVGAPDEAMVRGDESLLRIAITNLLDNARKFRPASAAGPVRIEVRRAGTGLQLSVESPGARVAAADAPRIFERFFRGAEARAAAEG